MIMSGPFFEKLPGLSVNLLRSTSIRTAVLLTQKDPKDLSSYVVIITNNTSFESYCEVLQSSAAFILNSNVEIYKIRYLNIFRNNCLSNYSFTDIMECKTSLESSCNCRKLCLLLRR